MSAMCVNKASTVLNKGLSWILGKLVYTKLVYIPMVQL